MLEYVIIKMLIGFIYQTLRCDKYYLYSMQQITISNDNHSHNDNENHSQLEFRSNP